MFYISFKIICIEIMKGMMKCCAIKHHAVMRCILALAMNDAGDDEMLCAIKHLSHELNSTSSDE